MNYLSIFMTVFAVIGAADYMIGNRFGVGKEFEKGFMLFGNLALSMIGMIVIAPLFAKLMEPLSNFVYSCFRIDPSVLPAMIFANDMGGAPLAAAVGKNETLGCFNGLVVAAMLGCTVSFTIPFSLATVKKEQHKLLLYGFLCGIITIPIGCFVAGLLCKIDIILLLINLLPMIVFSGLVALGLVFLPSLCIRLFGIFGQLIKIIIVIGLSLGIIRFLTGVEIIKGLATLEEGAMICLNASVVMTGAFPFLYILSKLLALPLKKLSSKIGINEASAKGFIFSLAASITTFKEMDKMDDKGVVLNSAFAISAAFVFADHLAFTMSFNKDYIPAMIIGKLIAGFSGLLLAAVMYKQKGEKHDKRNNI